MNLFLKETLFITYLFIFFGTVVSAENDSISLSLEKNVSVGVILAPVPFVGHRRNSQILGLRSIFKALPISTAYLLGNHPTFYAVAEEFDRRVVVDEKVDCNSYGTPLFNSMIKKAREVKEDYVVILSPEVEVGTNLLQAMKTAEDNSPKAVIFLPVKDSNSEINSLSGVPEVGLWMWSRSNDPFLNVTIPPFVYKRGSHDLWFGNQLISQSEISVVDAGNVVSCQKAQEKRRKLLEISRKLRSFSVESSTEMQLALLRVKKWNSLRKRPQEISLNEKFSEMREAECQTGNCPLKGKVQRLKLCSEELGEKLHSFLSLFSRMQNRSMKYFFFFYTETGETSFCVENIDCQSSSSDWSCKYVQYRNTHAPNVPKNLDLSLSKFSQDFELVLRQSSFRKVVVLVSVTYGYRDLLMNFVCNLRRLGIQGPTVVALDGKLYEFAMEQGLHVIYGGIEAGDGGGDNEKEIKSCEYGSDCFRKVTKLKSRLVLKALKLGYNVVWSDADVIWFKDPIPELLKYEKGTFPIQSDSPSEEIPPNSNLNSGFYFARAEYKVIKAFESITELAKVFDGSEQPCFYTILCEGQNSTVGENECIWRDNGLRTIVLPLTLYPNGSYRNYFNSSELCRPEGCFVIHNNWVLGEEKIQRLVDRNLWYFDETSRSCLYV